MIEFSLPIALLVIFFSAFLPGVFLSLAILKKSDFSLLEKLLIGFAIGWILQAFLPFAEFIFLNIKFSYTLTLVNIGLSYVLTVGAFVYFKAYEKLREEITSLSNILNKPAEYIIPFFVILIFVLNFFIRIQTLSPIYQELDPYYYIYIAQQVIVEGYNPFNDKTAWYPEIEINHRSNPFLSYLEASWYILYQNIQNPQNQVYDNYILSLIANIYPPFAAAFAVFFLYLGLRAWYRSEYALIASAILSFMPIFIIKLTAGEAEVQPYAFFALSMFLCLFLWAQKKQSIRYMVLAGIAYSAISLASSSEIIAVTIFMLFTILQSLTLFFTKKNLENFMKLCGTFLMFSILTAVLKSIFILHPIIIYPAANVFAVAFVFVLFMLQKSKFDLEMQFYIFGGIVIVGIFAFAFTPLGHFIKDIALIGLQIAEYNKPLDRTIAEQGTSGAIFEPLLGFVGKVFDDPNIVSSILGLFASIPSMLANIVFVLFSVLINSIFGVNINYTVKENSILMALLFYSMLASVYGIYKIVYKKEETPVWFFVALVFPIALIGLIKAKYIIYLGFVLAATIPFVFGELEKLLGDIFDKYKFGNESKKQIFYCFLVLGVIMVIMQFTESIAPAVINSSFTTRFQDNPLALQQKFSDLCDRLTLKGQGDADICAAGKDAIGYSNKSTNNQYNLKLCIYSLVKDPFDPKEDTRAVGFRCERISDYWIESMEWIRYNTENDSRITSWWDYGHWENYFGQRNAVIRNEHVSHNMIGEIAHDYISGTPMELKEDMIKYNSSYALFDVELLFSGNSFGGKYGALNYLACARNNLTNVSKRPGTSTCEFEHLWTQVYVPTNSLPEEQCSISFNQKGVSVYAFRFKKVNDEVKYELIPSYCLGQTTLFDGSNISALYELNNRSVDGNLKLHRAFLRPDSQTEDKKWKIFTLLYSREPVWIMDGTITSGWDDRIGKFYDSNLYNAFVLGNLPGFELVYTTKDNAVKIYKIK